jgi:hypothetical protein
MNKFLLAVILMSVSQGFASEEKITLHLNQHVACPTSVVNEANVDVLISRSADGSVWGEGGKFIRVENCGFKAWVSLEISREPGTGPYRINAIQYFSEDGKNGLGVGQVSCETDDLTKIPKCSMQHILRWPNHIMTIASIRISPAQGNAYSTLR